MYVSETDLFFLAISMVGTDFSLIGQLLTHRSRSAIKVFPFSLYFYPQNSDFLNVVGSSNIALNEGYIAFYLIMLFIE